MAGEGPASVVMGLHPALGHGIPGLGEPERDQRQGGGEDFPGVVGTDRYGAYHWVDPHRRPLCWAHLTRDFIAFVERGGRRPGSAQPCWRRERNCVASGIEYAMAHWGGPTFKCACCP